MRRIGHLFTQASHRCHWQSQEYSLFKEEIKDTSGVGVSPHTHIRSDQQLSGRLLGRLEGRSVSVSVSVSVSRMRVINDFDRE